MISTIIKLLTGIVTITNYDTLNDDVINILSNYNNIQNNKMNYIQTC